MSPSWTTSLTPIKAHYELAFERYGDTPQGADWKDMEAQYGRLQELTNLWKGDSSSYSVNDWGCGYCAIADYIPSRVTYYGYDISQKLIDGGVRRPNFQFILSDHPTKIADYTVASGLFNVKGVGEWDSYVIQCIWKMYEMSRKGFGFNLLHERADRKRDDLFYTTPEWAVNKLPSGLRVSILQYYSPYDFTILCHR